MGGPVVVAFLSTGRCGTQWLTSGLRELHPELDAEHEPIGPMYMPRMYFRCYARPDAILSVPAVRDHIARVEHATRPYVETGWPIFAALPLLADRLSDRLRVVHLTRHPVPTALSHLAHNSYAGSARDDAYTQLATLGPRDPNVFQPHYVHAWDRLSAYEKCLFWWTEVSLFGIELPHRRGEIPFMRIRSEDMFCAESPALGQLLEFMELSWDDRWHAHAQRPVDRWHHHTDREIDPRQVHRHPITVAVARMLGYDTSRLDLAALEMRYRGKPNPGIDRSRRVGALAVAEEAKVSEPRPQANMGR